MKERLDTILHDRGFFDSREKAKAAVMAGIVYVDGSRIDKAGTKIDPCLPIEIQGDTCPYVSRGGLKLEKAIEEFGIDLNGKICIDIGASTGGFTDCMLKSGSAKVYAIDVGYGQLDWKLRNDERVINIERTNIRYLDDDLIEEGVDFISVDVSFISLKHIFPVASRHLKDGGKILTLIKPQFEAGKDKVGKGGIVKDSKVQREVLEATIDHASHSELYPTELTFSPIKGAKGNIEFLACFERRGGTVDIQETVREAQEILSGGTQR